MGIELVFDEIRTHQMNPHRTLRSKTADLVKQEIWVILITHYAAQVFMSEAADDVGRRRPVLLHQNDQHHPLPGFHQAAISPLTT